MRRHLPNLLTILRLALAAIFFILINQYRYPGSESILWSSLVIFTLAGITDLLDGYLARRWQVETTFGRIMDPFCDKVLTLGAFIYLAGPRFVNPDWVEAGNYFTMISGVYPWMIALMLARELLVTDLRMAHENKGTKFGANLWGKSKATLQMSAIPVIIGLVALDPVQDGHQWMGVVRDTLVYATVAVTFISGLPYIKSAVVAMRQ